MCVLAFSVYASMSDVLIFKDQSGKLAGFGEKGARAYARFRKAVDELAVGELLKFSYWIPRSPKFHKLHFVMLDELFKAQEQFNDDEQFRKWTEVGAGHCDFVPGPKGRMVALPKSIAYHALDDEDFGKVHENVKAFLRTVHARSFLWPHMTPERSAEMVQTLIEQFEVSA